MYKFESATTSTFEYIRKFVKAVLTVHESATCIFIRFFYIYFRCTVPKKNVFFSQAVHEIRYILKMKPMTQMPFKLDIYPTGKYLVQ